LIASVLAMLVTLYAKRSVPRAWISAVSDGGGLDNAFQSIQLALIPDTFARPAVHTLWYLNRAPARTYFARPANAAVKQ
jgi:hypothetical protein